MVVVVLLLVLVRPLLVVMLLLLLLLVVASALVITAVLLLLDHEYGHERHGECTQHTLTALLHAACRRPRLAMASEATPYTVLLLLLLLARPPRADAHTCTLWW
jgi:hypothetical protein